MYKSGQIWAQNLCILWSVLMCWHQQNAKIFGYWACLLVLGIFFCISWVPPPPGTSISALLPMMADLWFVSTHWHKCTVYACQIKWEFHFLAIRGKLTEPKAENKPKEILWQPTKTGREEKIISVSTFLWEVSEVVVCWCPPRRVTIILLREVFMGCNTLLDRELRCVMFELAAHDWWKSIRQTPDSLEQ